ncbi:MAG: 2-amino-4-hydroxy-6-hydroxymethyldihydropteridine diphosphokinase [Phycisphaerales bacterium]|nr:MAG: 2-amino-4-hydroxy-6-hydroxymethyldihydropteridine diphosphokinase [Phycisphaerales bacterium]
MAQSTTAYVGLGSNLGDRARYIADAVRMLSEQPALRSVETGDVLETKPLGRGDHHPYLNAVARVRTTLAPEDLLRTLQRIEKGLGRTRPEKWAPRTIDLDLLLFGEDIIDLPHLKVPHPRMHLRSFVLIGLCRLDPTLRHPVLEATVRELAERLNGGDFALDARVPQLVSIAGNIGAGKTTLANKLSARFGCPLLLEPYDTNPFMPDVYAGRKELALDSQLYFLTSRIDQLSPDSLSAGQIVLTDYVFDKEMIYARRLLDERQLELYEKTYAPLAARVAEPVLVLYLRDSAEECLQRIHDRNRPYEQQITLDFLKDLAGDYETLFDNWKNCPVIRLNTPNLDYGDGNTIARLADHLRHYLSTESVACSSPQVKS